MSPSQENQPVTSPSPVPARSGGPWLGLVFLMVVAACLLLAMRIKFSSVEDDGLSGPAIGKALPRLELQSAADRSKVDLAQVAGKVVLLNFWGPWCPPCREEMPGLLKMAERFSKNPNFVFLSVSCSPSIDDDEKRLIEDSNSYLKINKFDLPYYVDPQASTRWGIIGLKSSREFGYPTTMILDREGKIRGLWEGYDDGYKVVDEKNMTKLLNELLPQQ